ncbi:unnamed protein product [Clavelina lepadiformis]|uniref:Uncharacterized protein n=1 Tax=Clavelina lepadiformis TaxID=159417 RepID=A0ABP0GG35_CLALP
MAEKKDELSKAFNNLGRGKMEPETYKMTKSKPGRAYIFNHYDFEKSRNKFNTKSFVWIQFEHLDFNEQINKHFPFISVNVKEREGTEIDVENLKTMFNRMGIEIEIMNDLTLRKLLEKLEAISKEDFSDYNCCFVVFLSHGKEDSILTYDLPLHYDSIFPNFSSSKCPGLEGKPKIFIVQACKGSDTATPPDKTPQGDFEESDLAYVVQAEFEDGVSPVAPIGADCISCFASATDNSDWELDFASLMTIVAERVADMGSCTGEKRQMPCTVSTLRKRFYLPKINDDAMM